ncbi:hypothetical protein V498_07495 [Pseudogymnoascus sp. VKM F-4517 (FW-2822)]|nr:hypothetical protein V498_07495 [Pseudogymnoascus sp. VKM F-4517 (FW-2822)]
MSRGGKLAPEVNRALFVKNLSYNVTPEELFDLFGKFGPIRQVRQGIANNTKGTAFVVFEDVMDAKQACDKLNGFNFQSRYLVVLYHQPEKMKSKEDLEARKENLEQLKRQHATKVSAGPSGPSKAQSDVNDRGDGGRGAGSSGQAPGPALGYGVSGVHFKTTQTYHDSFFSTNDIVVHILHATHSSVYTQTPRADSTTYTPHQKPAERRGGSPQRLKHPHKPASTTTYKPPYLTLNNILHPIEPYHPAPGARRHHGLTNYNADLHPRSTRLLHRSGHHDLHHQKRRMRAPRPVCPVRSARARRAGAAGAGVQAVARAAAAASEGVGTTIGIPILIFFLHLLTRLFLLTPLGEPPQSIESGNYGSPPRAKWWMKQSLIYFIGLLSMKFIVLLIFIFLPWISHIGDWALRWTEGDENLQVFFVMLFFPVVMNATQYYIIDTFIKRKLEGIEGGLAVEDAVDSDDEGGDEAAGLLAADVDVVQKKRKSSNDAADSGSGGSSRSGAGQAKLLTESEEGDEDADEVWLTQDQRDERR